MEESPKTKILKKIAIDRIVQARCRAENKNILLSQTYIY